MSDTDADALETAVLRIIGRSVAVGECYEWLGAFNSGGRPVIRWRGRTELVARLVLRWALGRPIAPRMLACHTCDNPACVRPEHLEEGTHSRNLRDAWARTRRMRPRSFTAEREG